MVFLFISFFLFFFFFHGDPFSGEDIFITCSNISVRSYNPSCIQRQCDNLFVCRLFYPSNNIYESDFLFATTRGNFLIAEKIPCSCILPRNLKYRRNPIIFDVPFITALCSTENCFK